MYRTEYNGYGQLLTEREFTQAVSGLGLAVPDDYDISPMEYYSHEFYGMDAMPTAEETKGWLKKNWPWLAIGGAGLVGIGIVLKVVL